MAASAVMATPAGASTTQNGVTTFGYTGAEETFTVPSGVTRLGLIAVGGRGGNGGLYFDGPGGTGGTGARVTTVLDVTPGQVLFIRVGSNGQPAVFDGPGGVGGFNGGGSGNSGININGGGASGGGGGATDIRTCGATQPVCAPPATSSISSRIVVAGGGGGGGGGSSSATSGGAGGNAGSSGDGTGGNGTNGSFGGFSGDGGAGATVSAGGLGGTSRNTVPPLPVAPSGVLVDGGAGLASGNPGAGGGGGGGIYGGGGAGSGFGGGGGGAGSSTGPVGETTIETDTSGVPRVVIHHAAPSVVTGTASGVGVSAATLAGTVNPQLLPTTYTFEYGTDGQLTESVPASGDAGSGSTASAVSESIQGLSPDTTYHYRLVAENANGTTQGEIRTFRTAALPPSVVTEPKADVAIALKPRRTARLRSRFAYGFTLTNYGPSNVDRLTLSGTLARGLVFVGGSRECSANGRRVVCTFTDVAAGRSPWATIRVRATRRGVQRSKFTVSSNLIETGSTVNTITARTRVN